MKYGKFVSEKHLQMQAKEIAMFKQAIEDVIKSTSAPFELVGLESSDYGTYYTFKATKPCKKRHKGNRQSGIDTISVNVYKSAGFLDVTDWSTERNIRKDYENAPKFQYEAYIHINGEVIPYRCRNSVSVMLPSAFQYGTDITDYNFQSAFKYIAEMF